MLTFVIRPQRAPPVAGEPPGNIIDLTPAILNYSDTGYALYLSRFNESHPTWSRQLEAESPNRGLISQRCVCYYFVRMAQRPNIQISEIRSPWINKFCCTRHQILPSYYELQLIFVKDYKWRRIAEVISQEPTEKSELPSRHFTPSHL